MRKNQVIIFKKRDKGLGEVLGFPQDLRPCTLFFGDNKSE